MSRRVLDSNIGTADIDAIMDSIVAQNPQLNAQIEKVHNESNVFLCKVLRIYSYDDKALVRVLDTGKDVYCNLSHEILGRDVSIDYLPEGTEKIVNGQKFIEPNVNLYGILIKVRWENLKNENVLLGYVNVYGHDNLRSSNNKGDISLKNGASTFSITNERVNIMTPALFINGLPYEAPELENYYNKTESDIIANSLSDELQQNVDELNERIDNIDTSQEYHGNLELDLSMDTLSNGYLSIEAKLLKTDEVVDNGN